MSYFTTSWNTSIYYECYGDKAKPPLILIHGLAADLKIWHPQVEELKKHFYVCAFDIPGHGQSGRQADYNIHKMPNVLKELMEHLELSHAHIIGHSIGCAIALLFSVQHPKATLSLVLQGPAAGYLPISNPLTWPGLLQTCLTLNLILLMWTVLGKKTSGKIINWVGQTYQYSTLLTGMEEEVDPKAMKDLAYSNYNAPYRGKLHAVKAPVMVIRGLTDQFPRKYSLYIKEHLPAPCLWYEVPLAQHLVALEKPLEFNLAAVSFIQKFESEDLAALAKSLSEASLATSGYQFHPKKY